MAVAIITIAIVRERLARKHGDSPTRTFRLRAVAVRADADGPFRTSPRNEPPALRPAESRPIEEVVAALRAGGLAPSVTRRGFDLPGTAPHQYLRVVALDRRRVVPDELLVVTNDGETAIDLAFTLVPLFGPIAVDFKEAAWIIVDGTRDVASLRQELTGRYKHGAL
jgi:hypothetical protein